MSDQIVLESYLTFCLDDEFFATNVSKVFEIMEIPRITRVPLSPSYMRGVINVRGNVIPVIDTRAKFGLPEKADTVNSCIIVLSVAVEGEQITIGAVVDSLHEVVEFGDREVRPAPSIGAGYSPGFILGMVESGDRFIMILDPDAVFSSDEVSYLKEIVEGA